MEYCNYYDFINDKNDLKIENLDLDKNNINFWISRNFYK